MADRLKSYEDFWPFYLGEHASHTTKQWHVVGTGSGMVCHFILLWVTRSLWWFPLGFVCGYLCAWYSHFTIEHNRPATFKHPYWSFFADFEQFYLMLLGWIPAELEKLKATGALPPSPARKAFRVLNQVWVFSYFALVGYAWWSGLLSWTRPF